MPWRKELRKHVSMRVAVMLDRLTAKQASALQEIRLRTGCAAALSYPWGTEETGVVFSDADIQDLVAALTGYARYRYERQIAEGYIPVEGGHRAGVCGRMTLEGGTWRMAHVHSVCLRISRRTPGAAKGIYRHLITPEGVLRSLLLMGPPGCGKTTALLDAAGYLSETMGRHVAVVDERGEMSSLLQEGMRIDVLTGCTRAKGMMMLLRTMSPEAMICDEIGNREDAAAVEEAARCGTAVLASAHADSVAALLRRPTIKQLFLSGAFDRYVLLGRVGRVNAVYDSEGKELMGEDTDGELGDGRYGHDRRLCGGVLAF